MKRDLEEISKKTYDLAIVGGGIYGATAAWEAVLQGLSVVLVDKGDFGGATSSNSTKIAHGGLRYLQHLDFKRMRESIRERSNFMRIAPHLVRPQSYLIPTYGHGAKGREMMAAALFVNDMISMDRKWFKDPCRRIPDARVISKEKCLRLMPGFKQEGLTGGAIWYDGQMLNTERLTFSFLLSAAAKGLNLANYAETIDFIRTGNRMEGIRVRDVLSGGEFGIKARMTLNTAGPWAAKLLNLIPELGAYRIPLTKVLSFVSRQIHPTQAFGVYAKTMFHDRQSVVEKKSQLLFAIPWRNYSVLGSYHLPHNGNADAWRASESEISDFLKHFNDAYPDACLEREDIRFVLSGLMPADNKVANAMLKHYKILDHAKENGLEGLVTLIGIKYTTARDVSAKTLRIILKKLGKKPRCRGSAGIALAGGEIPHFDRFMQQALIERPQNVSEQSMRHLAFQYGTAYRRILAYGREDPALLETLSPETEVLKAEVLHAVREEMAVKLADAVFRRTDLGSAGHPGEAALKTAVCLMADELGWDDARLEAELNETEQRFSSVLSAVS